MKRLSLLLDRHGWIVLLVSLVMTGLSIAVLPLPYDDDVVGFLPESDPEVDAFNSIMERFGSLNVGLVGVESPDIFTHERLTYIRKLASAMKSEPAVDAVTALTEVAIIKGAAEGNLKALVPHEIPTGATALAAMRKEILGLDYIVGALVSKDGTSARLVLQLANQVDGVKITSKEAAERVKAAVDAVAPPDASTIYHFGGAPFIAEAAANGSQEDLKRLAPYICLIILVLILLTLGSIRLGIITVVAVGFGILWTMGIMGWFGFPLTLISTSLPVILVALGSAYAVHLLVWYRDHGGDVGEMLQEIGWPVLVAGLTTVAGFISFLVMDLKPMRDFGWQMALGTGLCAVISLTVIPAFLHRFPIPPSEPSRLSRRIDAWLGRVAATAQRARWAVLFVAVAIAGFFAVQLPGIVTRMDIAAFFEDDSAPARADRFMADKFGGSVFLQVMFEGAVTEPAVLQQIAAFEDRLEGVAGVTQIESFARVIAVVEESMRGQRRIPPERKAIETYGYLAMQENQAVRLLVDREWTGALVQVAIGGFDTETVGRVADEIRGLAAKHVPGWIASVKRGGDRWPAVVRDAAERVAVLTNSGAEGLGVDAIAAELTAGADVDAEAALKILKNALTVEIEEDGMVVLRDDAKIDSLAADLLGLVTNDRFKRAAFLKTLDSYAAESELKNRKAYDPAARTIFTRLERELAPLTVGMVAERLAGLLKHVEDPTRRLRVQAIAEELRRETSFIGAAAPATASAPPALKATVSGYPIIQEAMASSVRRNQESSLMVSLPLVLLILIVVFRSVVAGLIGLVPTGLTLLVTFGLMGLLGPNLPMDIAASMLASIALGVGIDYAIHFLWRYRKEGLVDAMKHTGRAIVINAAEITAGFIVLAWASIVPMSRFGILTAQTLAVAALATLVLLPALLVWWRPKTPTPSPPSSAKS